MTEIEPTEQSWDIIRRKLGVSSGGADPSSGNLAAGQILKNRLLQVDPNVSQAGVPSYKLRSALSRADTREEKEARLTAILGDGGWSIDTYGRYMATPSGIQALGLPETVQNVRIDEPGGTRYDLADVEGDVPAIVGATIGGVLAPATGGLSLAAASATGGMIGKGIEEAREALMGENLQTLPEVAKDIGMEGVYAGAGELAMGPARWLGRKVLAPQGHRMTDIKRRALQEAREINVQPSPTQITEAPIVGRAQGMMNMIFGDPLEAKNAAAVSAEMHRLKNSLFPKTMSAEDAGKNVKANIGSARQAVSKEAEGISNKIDELTDGAAVISTERLKRIAAELLDELAKNQKTGQPLFTAPERVAQINDIIEGLDPYITVAKNTRVVNKLWSAIDDNTILPGISSHDARTLWGAARGNFEDINPALPAHLRKKVRGTIKAFRNRYKKRIAEFDNSIIARLTKDERFAGSVDPELVTETIFKKGSRSNILKVVKHLKPETYDMVRQVAMRNLLQGPRTGFRTRDAHGAFQIFQGEKLLKALDGYGKPTLNAMFGKEKTQELYRLARVTKLITTRKNLSGGFVAASIALHPIANLGVLIKLNIMSKIMNSKGGMKWLTDGFEAPRTRKGTDALARLYTMSKILKEDHTRQIGTYRPSDATEPMSIPEDNLSLRPDFQPRLRPPVSQNVPLFGNTQPPQPQMSPENMAMLEALKRVPTQERGFTPVPNR